MSQDTPDHPKDERSSVDVNHLAGLARLAVAEGARKQTGTDLHANEALG